MTTMHTTMYTHYDASDGNAGWLPLVIFNAQSIPEADLSFVQDLIDAEKWGELLEYLAAHEVEHILIKPPTQ